MRGLWIALVAVVAVPAVVKAQSEDAIPSCRAHMDGQQLTTSIEFSSGYRVEGPWHVLKNQAVALADGRSGVVLGAVLDEIVEVDVSSGNRSAMPLPKPIAVQFQAATQQELVTKAATVFCFSVVKARSESMHETASTGNARAADDR